MISNEAARYKSFLIIVELKDGPGGEAVVDEIGVHLAVSIHGRNGAIVHSKGGISLLKEEADIGILETALRRTVRLDIIG